MPQPTLLSYFSKPTSTSAGAHNVVGADEHLRVNTAHNNSSSKTESQSNEPSIVSSLLDQASASRAAKTTSSEPTPDNTKDANINGTSHDSITNVSLGAIEGFSNADKFAQIVVVPHRPEAVIVPVQQAHLPAIQRLTSTTLPVHYNQSFFTSTLTDPVASQLSRTVLYHSEPVGWIRCRLESCSPTTNTGLSKNAPSQIYIQALALLAPYRSLGLATSLLETVLSSSIAKSSGTVCIYAHVWERNEDALDWYAKRDFKRVMLVDMYYRKLRPAGAWIVRRELNWP
ncbi:uncharacterized protein PV06_09255 [Exophiala oligosperma]|uniref:N-acetyltransferase domain-containing protein n=2 Tax=Chaetothyriales TaxID=34395 RepID=A0A0D2DR99_9EURO|nr:uncharacterized protein PV06_09255 [Exophiala oligosperma]KAJ9618013.1 hypothetical protein H2204_013243 [Knufia peltigerae]KIW38274.1 hypothetical protein PV06_09255 [Exophiala oligosperma]